MAIVAASLLGLVGACVNREAAPEWSDSVDSMYDGWSGSLTGGSEATLLRWTPLTSEGAGSLHLLSADGSVEPLGGVHLGATAVSPSGEVFAVADPALGNNPGIDVVNARTGERRRKIDGLTDDRQWQNLLFITETDIVWTSAIEPDDDGNLVYHLVHSDLLTRGSTTVATFSDIDAMELSPDRSRLALAASPVDGDPHGLWIVDLSTWRLDEVETRGVDVQYIEWRSDGERFLEAKDRAQARPTGSGRSDADDFLTDRDVRPGAIYRWTDEEIVPFHRDFGAHEPGQFSLSPDGSTLAVTAWRKRNDEGVSSLWLLDVATRKARKITTGDDHVGDGDPSVFSPDGRFVALQRGRRIQVIETGTGAKTTMNPTGTWASLTFTWEAIWKEDSLLFFSNMGDTSGNRSRPGRLKLWRWDASDTSFTEATTRPGHPPSARERARQNK